MLDVYARISFIPVWARWRRPTGLATLAEADT
jgi:hypothetical protein